MWETNNISTQSKLLYSVGEARRGHINLVEMVCIYKRPSPGQHHHTVLILPATWAIGLCLGSDTK